MSGGPASGKTTTARALARQFDRAVHLDDDELQRFIVTGRVRPTGEPAGEALLQLDLRQQNLASLADNFVAAGFVVVLDHLVASVDRLNSLLGYLRSRPVVLVSLVPSAHVALARDARREVPRAADWIHLYEQIETSIRHVGMRINNENLSVDDVVREIVDNGPSVGIVG